MPEESKTISPESIKELGEAKKINLEKLEEEGLLSIDLKNLNSAELGKVKQLYDKIQEYLSPEEQEYYRNKRLSQQKILDKKTTTLEEQLDKAAIQERFEIPQGSNTHYNFIGYDSQQYIEIMELANQADDIPLKDRGTKEYLSIETKLYKMMVLYSLSGIPPAVVDEIPYRLLAWYYRLFKKKNDEPLPFGQKG